MANYQFELGKCYPKIYCKIKTMYTKNKKYNRNSLKKFEINDSRKVECLRLFYFHTLAPSALQVSQTSLPKRWLVR